MVHSPCGPAYGRTRLGCCQGGTCKQNFPKPTHPHTELSNGSSVIRNIEDEVWMKEVTLVTSDMVVCATKFVDPHV